MTYMCVLVFARGSIVLRWFACTILIRNPNASTSTNYAFKLTKHVQGPCTLSKAKGCKTQDGVKGKQSILIYT